MIYALRVYNRLRGRMVWCGINVKADSYVAAERIARRLVLEFGSECTAWDLVEAIGIKGGVTIEEGSIYGRGKD